MCESTFKLRITIEHTGCLCNTLKSKIAHKTNKIQTVKKKKKTIANELFQVSIVRRFKYRVKGIDDSLSTDTTELSSTNVEYKKQRMSELDEFH